MLQQESPNDVESADQGADAYELTSGGREVLAAIRWLSRDGEPGETAGEGQRRSPAPGSNAPS